MVNNSNTIIDEIQKAVNHSEYITEYPQNNREVPKQIYIQINTNTPAKENIDPIKQFFEQEIPEKIQNEINCTLYQNSIIRIIPTVLSRDENAEELHLQRISPESKQILNQLISNLQYFYEQTKITQQFQQKPILNLQKTNNKTDKTKLQIDSNLLIPVQKSNLISFCPQSRISHIVDVTKITKPQSRSYYNLYLKEYPESKKEQTRQNIKLLPSYLSQLLFECPQCDQNTVGMTNRSYPIFTCTNCHKTYTTSNNTKINQQNTLLPLEKVHKQLPKKFEQIGTELKTDFRAIEELQFPQSDSVKLDTNEINHKQQKQIYIRVQNTDQLQAYIFGPHIYISAPVEELPDIPIKTNEINHLQTNFCQNCSKKLQQGTEYYSFSPANEYIHFHINQTHTLKPDLENCVCKSCIKQLTQNSKKYIQSNLEFSEILARRI